MRAEFTNIYQLAHRKFKEESAAQPILIERHREILNSLIKESEKFHLLLGREIDVAILGSELYLIGRAIEELIGIVTPSDVLDHLFANFCIGK